MGVPLLGVPGISLELMVMEQIVCAEDYQVFVIQNIQDM